MKLFFSLEHLEPTVGLLISLISIVSQGVERPEERDGDGGVMASGAIRTHITFMDEAPHLRRARFRVSWTTTMSKVTDYRSKVIISQRSLITDHRNTCDNNGKVWNMERIIQKREMSTCCWKNGADRLACCRVTSTLSSCVKTQELQGAIKCSAVQRGMLLL